MEYEVGKYYDVICALLQSKNSDIITIVPIIGIVHTDPQFGSLKPHYHIDGRFVTKKVQAEFDMDGGRTNQAVWIEDGYSPYWNFKLTTTVRLKCKRLETGLIVDKITNHPKRYWWWYETMIGKSCAGKRCPHLGTEMLERDGVLICPLHNLIGDLKTEIIISK